MPPVLKVMRLDPSVQLPVYSTPGAAAFDIFAYLPEHDAAINSMSHASVVIPTGLKVEVPEGWVLKLYSRSGQAFKENTRLANCVGIIDSDYRGEVMVKLTRDDGGSMFITNGERVAQGMLERVERVAFAEVDELTSTQRGEGGLGSTGK